MGRTNPTYRDFLRAEEESWNDFRRSLRRRNKPHFDALFEGARQFAHAASHANATEPHRAMVLSMLVAQEAKLQQLRERVAELEAAGEG